MTLNVFTLHSQNEAVNFNKNAEYHLKTASDHYYDGEYDKAISIILDFKNKKELMNASVSSSYYNLTSKVYIQLGLYDEARLEATNHANLISKKKPIEGAIERNVSNELISYTSGDYLSAITSADSIAFFQKKLGNLIIVCVKKNNIGIYYQKLNDYIRAAQFFMLADQLLDSIFIPTSKRHWELKTAIHDNLAKNKELEEDWNGALKLYADNLLTTDSVADFFGPSSERRILTNIRIAHVLIQLKKYNLAKKHLSTAEYQISISPPMRMKKRKKEIKLLLNIGWGNYAESIRDVEMMKKYYVIIEQYYQDEKEKMKVALTSFGRLYKSQYDERVVQETRLQEKSKQLETETKKKQLAVLFGSIAFLGLIIFFIIKRAMYFKRKSDLISAKLKIEKLEVEKLSISLDYSKSDFKRVALMIERKELILKKLLVLSKETSRILDGKSVKSINAIIEEIRNELIVDRGKLNFHSQVEVVNSQFYEQLEKISPNLSELNKELCAQIVMKLSGNQIAILRGVNPASVTMAKARLKQRFGLSAGADLYEFLKTATDK